VAAELDCGGGFAAGGLASAAGRWLAGFAAGVVAVDVGSGGWAVAGAVAGGPSLLVPHPMLYRVPRDGRPAYCGLLFNRLDGRTAL